MIFHTINTITIDEFGYCFQRIETIKRFNIWVPKKWQQKAFSKLVKNYNKISNKEKEHDILSNEFEALKFEFKIRALDIVREILNKAWLDFEIPEEILEIYKDECFKDFTMKTPDLYKQSLSDLNHRIDRLTDGWKTLKAEQNAGAKMDFTDLVIRIKRLLDGKEIGKEKLYMMPYYIDEANKNMKLKNTE